MKKNFLLPIFLMGITCLIVTELSAQRISQNPKDNPAPDAEEVNKQVIVPLTGFELPDEAEANPSLKWATYIGGGGYEHGNGLALDAQGNTYAVGETSSSNLITRNPYQATYGGGSSDGFITKYSASGELLWSSYYGGAGLDAASKVRIDDNGNIYITGRTNSSSGMAQNGHQNSLSGGYDAFMVKFNSQGQRLWGTYYGGTGNEIVSDMDMDDEGNIYMAGETGSSSGIAYNGFSNTISGSVSGFLVKFNQNGERIWGTYYNGATYCRSVEVDNQNNVYLSGMTVTGSGMAFNGHQNSSGGYYDGFLVKFNASGQRLWATYYGGSNWDCIRDITTDANGNVFISGETYSSNGIAFNGFKNSFQSIRSDWADGFIVKLSAQGVRLWGTYFGGPDHDGGYRIDTDLAGNLFLLTSMRSASGIAYKAFQSTYGGGNNDLVIAKFNPMGNLLWATYYGSTGDDHPIMGLVDGSGNIYLTGRTSSPSGFTFNGSQNTYGGGSFDGFLVKFSDGPPPPDTDGDGVPDANDCAPNDNTKYRTANLYIDKDNDGYDAGQENVCYGASIPAGYKTTTLGADCDDENHAITLPRKWYKDADNDGYSDGAQLTQCTQPANYKLATELTATTGDCNDANAAIYPNAPEICDGLDNDCNGVGDEGAEVTWYKDADNDGYSDGTALTQCFKPEGYKLAGNLTATAGDCDDSKNTVYPNASELCDGLDNDCDAETDEGCPDGTSWYFDYDNDGYGNTDKMIIAATRPRGYVGRPGDCRDWDANFYPGAPELPDGKDNDCDGEVDEGLGCRKLWYHDRDGDGFGTTNITYQKWSCVQPGDYVAIGGDCMDWEPSVYPGAPDLCGDGLDNDCDGTKDEGANWYKDADNDGYSNGTMLVQCTQPDGYKPAGNLIATSGDCNDGNAAIHPGATELCDGIDNNCNGQTDEGVIITWYKDTDNDGYSNGTTLVHCSQPDGYKPVGNLLATTGDCNDANTAIHPGAMELCDGLDNNCDSQTDEGCPVATTWYFDYDKDGYGNPNKIVQATTRPKGYVATSGDCRDWDPLSYPGATETGDGIDNNCNGLVDEGLDCLKTWYYDGDGDGYGSDAHIRLSCKQHNNYVALGGDCKNWDANVYPSHGCPPLTGIVSAEGNSTQPKAMVEASANIQVFPNPARNEITVTLNGFEVGKKLELHMVQADGKVVSGQSITPLTHGQQVRINVSRLSAGYYLLQVRQGVLQQTKKVLIVK